MSDNKRDSRWMERRPEGEQPSADDVRRIVLEDTDRFLAASKRAVQVLEEEVPVPVYKHALTGWGWSVAGIAVVICVVLFALNLNRVDIQSLLITPAEADYLTGIQGWVVSSHDLTPICGVDVFEQNADGTGPIRRIGITDAYGSFHVPPSAVDIVKLTFVYDGQKVPQIILDQDAQSSSGYVRVYLDLPPAQTTRTTEVQLNPGDQLEVLQGVTLALSNAASQPWSGSVTLDRNWPGFFAYSQCLEGLLRVEGPESEHLKVTLEIDLAKLNLYCPDPQSIKVITNSEKYLSCELNDEQTVWRAKAHNGWYDMADEYIRRLDQEGYGVNFQQPVFREHGNVVSVSWNPVVDEDYALLAPLQADGRVVACRFDYLRGSSHLQDLTLKLIERNQPITTLFEYRFYHPDEQGYFTDPSSLDRNQSNFSFDANSFVRNHEPESQGIYRLMGEDKYIMLPGKLTLACYDFVLSNPEVYPLQEVDFSTPPGEYTIEVSRGAVGEISTLTVTGDTERLAKLPQWDFYGDFITDANGFSADFRVTHSGEYNYNVILEEKCGNVIILERVLHFPAPWVAGYMQMVKDAPVIIGKQEPPKEPSSLSAYSEYAVSSPAAYGVATGQLAGPYLCIAPPEEFRGVPLKEMTIYLHAKGVAGDYDKMPLIAQVLAVNRLAELDEFGLWQFEFNPGFSDFHESTSKYWLNSNRNSWDIYDLSRGLTGPDAASIATTTLQDFSSDENVESWYPYYKEVIGIDLHNLASGAELVEKVQSYANGPYSCINTATNEVTELVSKVGLHEGMLDSAEYILIRIKMEDAATPYAGQWELYSGGDHPSRVEIETEDGRMFTTYFDYGPIIE